MNKVLEVKNLTKEFLVKRSGTRIKTAVDGISFNIYKGEIVGFLGPNGAGKSTTIEMILGLIKPTRGVIKIFGKDIEKNREHILSRMNYTSSYIQFMSKLTVKENLIFFGKLYNVKDIDDKIYELASVLDIKNLLNVMFFKLSSGQKARVVLAKAFINSPEFLLLDEPTSSMDPDIAYKVREALRKINKERNITMLYTSHNMSEIEEVCDRILFLQNGKIVAEGTPNELKQKVRDYYLEIAYKLEDESNIKSFLDKAGLKYCLEGDGHLRIKTRDIEIAKILKKLSKQDFNIYDIDIDKPSLEEVFLKIARTAGLSEDLSGGRQS